MTKDTAHRNKMHESKHDPVKFCTLYAAWEQETRSKVDCPLKHVL